jgi:hypothetical protein
MNYIVQSNSKTEQSVESLGVDQDNDGLFDDVQKSIESDLKNEPEIKILAINFARAMQARWTAKDSEVANAAQKYINEYKCLSAKVPENKKYEITNNIKSIMLSNRNRAAAELSFRQKLGGLVFEAPIKAVCD